MASAVDHRELALSRPGVIDLSILITNGASRHGDDDDDDECECHCPHRESGSTCTSSTASDSYLKTPNSLLSLSSQSSVSGCASPLSVTSTDSSSNSEGFDSERAPGVSTSQVQQLALTNSTTKRDARAVQLRMKRQSLEEWHTQHKSEITRVPCHSQKEDTALTPTSSTGSIAVHRSTGRDSELRPKPPRFARTRGWFERATNYRRGDKDERQRCLRIVERLQQAKSCLQVRCLELEQCSSQFVDIRRKIHANQERATIRLRLSQLEHALQYYQQRLSSKVSLGQAVPIDVLKVVSSLADVTKPTLHGHLNHILASMCTQYPDQLRKATAMTKELRMIGVEKLGPVAGNVIPHFTLQSNHREYFYSQLLSGKGRMVILVYLGHWSELCMATLRAWQDQYPALRQNSHGMAFPLIAIGTESVDACGHAAKKSGAVFPILSDPQGAEVLDPLGLVIRRGSMPVHPMSAIQKSHGSSEPLPMTATLVVDTSNMVILHSHVSVDVANRAEPMDIVASFFLE